MKRVGAKQGYAVRDASTLTPSAKAAQASARMFDQVTSSFLQLQDMAVTSSINAEVRESTKEGEMLGLAGGSKTQTEEFSVPVEQPDGTTLYYRGSGDGSFEGYEEKAPIFKWDVAANIAAKNAFDSNVNALSNSTFKELSKKVDGDEVAYANIAKRYLADAVANVSDDQQRQYITNAYAKSYNQHLPTVSTKYIEKEGKRTKMAWDDSREAFSDDVSVVMDLFYNAQSDLRRAEALEDGDGVREAEDRLYRYEEQLKTLRTTREGKGTGGVMMGVLSVEGVQRDTEEDIFNGYKAATVQKFRQNADDPESQNQVRKDVINTSTEILSPIKKQKMLQALDEELAHENAMSSAEYTKYQREKTLLTDEVNKTVRMGIIDVWESQDAMDNQEWGEWQAEVGTIIDEYYAAGFLTTEERKKYRDMLLNGDPVMNDNAEEYALIAANLDEFDIDYITGNELLTFQTKKELSKQWIDQKQNEPWMKSPAYREGKGMIREAFGFSEQGMMPEMLTKGNEKRRKEMNNLVEQYRATVRQGYLDGKPVNHYEIADNLLTTARKSGVSSLLNSDKLYINKKKTVEELQNVTERKKADFNTTVEQFEKQGGEIVEKQEEKAIVPADKSWMQTTPY